MDISGKVANIHMRTDAKNLVGHYKETIPMLRKEVCSGSIHDLANSELFGRLFDEGISEGKQLDHSSEDREIARC